MAKNKKNKNNHNQVKVKAEKSPEMLALERKVTELAEKRRQLEAKKADLSKQRNLLDKNSQQMEQQIEKAKNDLQKLNESAFEIRQAIRCIDELQLSAHAETAHTEIVSLLNEGKSESKSDTIKNSQNDEAILAVAVRYKLSDVVLYTEDKNLKNKAKALGIQTT